jgi:hypothetical protein
VGKVKYGHFFPTDIVSIPCGNPLTFEREFHILTDTSNPICQTQTIAESHGHPDFLGTPYLSFYFFGSFNALNRYDRKLLVFGSTEIVGKYAGYFGLDLDHFPGALLGVLRGLVLC